MKPLSDIKKQKNSLLKSFVLVTILSFGISMIVSYLTQNADTLITLIIGILFVLIVTFYYLREYFGCSASRVNVDTIITVDNNHSLISIPRLEFSEDLYQATHSVFAENKVYETVWKDAFLFGDEKSKKGKQLVVEFFQYLFIKKLSLNLNSFFNGLNNKSTVVIGREQIPDILLKNRVIEMISKPYEEREKFQKSLQKETSSPQKGTVVMMSGEDGALYDLLEIELPRKSRILIEGNSLIIKNRNFTICFNVRFEGFASSTRRYFESLYLGRSFHECRNYEVELSLSIRFSPFFLLSFRDWRYLEWLDSIGDVFFEYFSFDAFVEKIGFEKAATNQIVFQNYIKKTKKSDSKSASTPNKKIEQISIIREKVVSE